MILYLGQGRKYIENFGWKISWKSGHLGDLVKNGRIMFKTYLRKMEG
jgi:hypothetical protein